MLRSLLTGSIRTGAARLASTTASKLPEYETLKVIPDGHVYEVQLNAPEKLNAFTIQTWDEMIDCFQHLHLDSNCRAVVFSGNGRAFCAGIDLKSTLSKVYAITVDDELDVARKALRINQFLTKAQDGFTCIESCRKPVIVAIHGHCYGAATSLITAGDIRFTTTDAMLSVKEVDVGLAADVGVLQRLTKVTGNDSLARELVFTARVFSGSQAKEMGLVSRVFSTKEEMMTAAKALAKEIARKSPVAVQGSKIAMNYARNHSIRDGLEMMGYWNQGMLQTQDTIKSAMAMQAKQVPEYDDL